MGFTPLGGLMMTTRPGDLDPFIPVYLIKKLGWSVQTLEEYLNHQCGLKGLCGRSDMRDVAEAIKNNDSSAIFARDLFVYRVRKYIGALAAVLGGVDVLSFTGAMAENDALLRAEICREMEWLQIYIDPNRNRQLKEGERGNIAMPGRRNIFVIPSNEELQMAVEIYDRFASML
jgi:acetate kinase